MSDYQVGDRVRCINRSRFNGKEGTVNYVGMSGVYGVEWDGEPFTSLHGGSWSASALEAVEARDIDEELEAQQNYFADLIAEKNAALRIAAFVFGQYRDLHLAKGTNESTMKALTNMGLENVMLDALEAD